MLARRVAAAGHDLVVAAPASDASGSGAAIGLFHSDSRIDVRRVAIADCDAAGVGRRRTARSVRARGAPRRVRSPARDRRLGHQRGLNTGRAILHSGTVGAALTAQNFGAKGLAVSVAAGTPWQWDTAATIALEVLDVLARGAAAIGAQPERSFAPARSGQGRAVGAVGRVRCGARRSFPPSPTVTCRSSCARSTSSSHPTPTPHSSSRDSRR